ncbi:MAG: UDP-N-acetylmuramoyl-L-alanyl-D-glutamate--2,6-diaminopimelate ligase [Candidatus Omnitrophota bacterium]
MMLNRLIKEISPSKITGKVTGISVKGLTCNSKEAKKGDIFIAIQGVKRDGNLFIQEAIDRGACAIISQEHSFGLKLPWIVVKDCRKAAGDLASIFFGRPCEKLKFIGITGTNGKTTIAYLAEDILKEAGKKTGVIGTVNYRFNNKIIPSNNTTPGPLQLHSIFKRMRDGKIKYVVMEVSSHALEQDRVRGIDFSSAIFTNLTQDHLDYHKTLEEYFQTKARLFRNLSTGACAIINTDDRYSRRLRRLTKARVVTYGIDHQADFMAQKIKFDLQGTDFILKTPSLSLPLSVRLIGRYNVYNYLAAISWAMCQGLPWSKIDLAVRNFSYVPGRLERVDTARGFSVFVDYAHTEDALKNVIQALREVGRGRIIVVFGCGGDRDRSKRPKMGKVATELADLAIITSDNPRNEEPLAIIADIKKGIKKNNYLVIPQRKEAIMKSLFLAKKHDIVLLAGKGHEGYQIIKDKVFDFNDCQTVKECLTLAN